MLPMMLLKDRMSRLFLLTVVLLAITLMPANCQALPQLQVQGNHLVANGHTVRLRGINWGWWHFQNTLYTQTDMSNLSQWNANFVRLAFSYTDLETNGTWDETKALQMDQVINWAATYHLYVILDMHVAPGGQNTDAYTDGGGNLIWKNSSDQNNFLALWKQIASRYNSNTTVAAYELMNEPQTSTNSDIDLANLSGRAISAIRGVDPNKIIVLAGNSHDVATSLVDDIYQANQTNILYTFHFYDGNSGAWLNNLTEGPGISGTQGWTFLQTTFTAPSNATQLAIMLRSNVNSGTAWFDDVTLKDSSGNVLKNDTFSNGSTDGYSQEAGPASLISNDPNAGHGAPGSLAIHNTIGYSYNGCVGPQVTIVGGQTYTLSAWVQLSQATGNTFLNAAFFTNVPLPKASLQSLMQQPVKFSGDHTVPVWAGEFGCPANAPNNGQSQWTSDCIALFEQAGFDWSYWNFHETTDPSSMALQAEYSNGSNYPINGNLLSTLNFGWALNWITDGNHTFNPQCAPNSRLDVQGAGKVNQTPVQIFTANPTTAQVWTVTNMGGNQYKIAATCAPGLVLDVDRANSTSGTKVQIYADNGSTAQRWVPTAVSGGFTFSPVCAPGLVLDVVNGLSADGTLVQIATPNGGSAQTWAVH